MGIKKLKKQRNNIYKQMQKIDVQIEKEYERENEETKEKYVGKYFVRKGYEKFPEYVNVLRYNKTKGFEVINLNVDNGDTWISRYYTGYAQADWVRCSKELFLEKLKKGLKQIQCQKK